MPTIRLFAFLSVAIIAFPGMAAAEESAGFVPDVVYGRKDGLAMTFDVFKPAKPNGAGVLFMMSGGWHSMWLPREFTEKYHKELLEHGFTVFHVRHGSEPRYFVPDAVSDVRRAACHIRLHAKDYGVDPERLGVYGSSAGGHLSLVLGTTSDEGSPDDKDPVERTSDRMQAVVAFMPPSDLRDWVRDRPENLKRFKALDFDLKLAEGVSPLPNVSPDDAPTLLIHGLKDDLVPPSHSEQIFAAFKEKGVETDYIKVENAGHGFVPDEQARLNGEMVRWFEKHLLKGKTQ